MAAISSLDGLHAVLRSYEVLQGSDDFNGTLGLCGIDAPELGVQILDRESNPFPFVPFLNVGLHNNMISDDVILKQLGWNTSLTTL